MERKPKTLQPFIKMCATIGALPTSYLVSMTYEEQLIWLCNFLEKEVIPVVNNNSEVVKELQEWFENLDVQEEVNNKIEEMYESGQLQEIITQYLEISGVLGFDTIANLKSSTNLIEGSICKTIGSLTYNDGKGNYFKIRQLTSGDVIDEKTLFALTNFETLVAEILPDFYLNEVKEDVTTLEKSVGTISESISEIKDDIESIEESLSTYDIIVASDGSGDYTSVATAVSNATTGQTIYVKNGTYSDEIIDCLGKFLTIIGESKEGVVIQNSSGQYSQPVFNIGKGILKNLTINQNGYVNGVVAYALHIDNNDLTSNKLLIENCYIYSHSDAGLGIGLRPYGTVELINCEVYSDAIRNTDLDNGAIFCHTSQEAEGPQQLLILKNCFIHSLNRSAIKLQSCKTEINKGWLEAYNTSLYSDYYKYSSELIVRDRYVSATTDNMLLSLKNSNNTPILDYSEYSNSYDVMIGKFLNDQVEYPIKRHIFYGNITANTEVNINLKNALPNIGGIININGTLTETATGLQIQYNYNDGTNYFRSYQTTADNTYMTYLNSNLTGRYQLIVDYWANTQ